MSTAPHLTNPTCTHERRPGTTVCLLCRQEARLAVSDRRKRWFLRGAAVGIVIVVIAIGLSSVTFLRGRAAAKENSATGTVGFSHADTTATAESVTPQGSPTAASPSVAPPSVASPTTSVAVAAAPPSAFAPIVHAGETSLQFGVTATRSDSGILVKFDTPDLRTRMPEKFERFLRWSLPQLYGPRADSLLARVPLGELVAQGNLLYELPTRGIHLPVEAGWRLDIYPEIRPGQDGPLVIRYRASVRKD